MATRRGPRPPPPALPLLDWLRRENSDEVDPAPRLCKEGFQIRLHAERDIAAFAHSSWPSRRVYA